MQTMQEREYNIPTLPLPYDLETKAVLLQLNRSNRSLAELKGASKIIPNEGILINTLALQEARESSSIENVITTQDELYQAGVDGNYVFANPATKEVLNYREAMEEGFHRVARQGMLTNNVIKAVQETLEHNKAGFRRDAVLLKNSAGDVVYTPPRDWMDVERLMGNLECFINDDSLADCDPLIKMAIIHHQFESIHPFYDGNGRTGRIINVLYLIREGLLDFPILYLSRYITRNKNAYYSRLQDVRAQAPDNAEAWEAWILYMLKGIEETAVETLKLVHGIAGLMQHVKSVLKAEFGASYSHAMLNNLFFHPYTKIEFVMRDLEVSRPTAGAYLRRMVQRGLLRMEKIGRSNFYVNSALLDLFLPSSSR